MYHEPDTVTELLEDPVKPSAAKVPGGGMFGIDVLTVSLSGSYMISYIVSASESAIWSPVLSADLVVELRSPIASAIRCAALAGSVDLRSGPCSGPS